MEFTHELSFYCDKLVTETNTIKPKWYQFWKKPVTSILERAENHRYVMYLREHEAEYLLAIEYKHDFRWEMLIRAICNQDVMNIRMLQIEVTIQADPYMPTNNTEHYPPNKPR